MTTLTFPELTEAEGKLSAKQAELGNIMAEAQPGGEGTIDLAAVKCISGSSAEKAATIKALNDECADLATKYENLKATFSIAERRDNGSWVAGSEADDAPKSKAKNVDPYAVMAKSKAMRVATKGVEDELDLNLKTRIPKCCQQSDKARV